MMMLCVEKSYVNRQACHVTGNLTCIHVPFVMLNIVMCSPISGTHKVICMSVLGAKQLSVSDGFCHAIYRYTNIIIAIEIYRIKTHLKYIN